MTKITALPENTSPSLEDLMAVVDDPSGTPALKRSTLAQVRQEVLLHDETLGGSAAFDVTGISQDFDDLLLFVSIRSTVAATEDIGYILFNADATIANYHTQRHWSLNGGSNGAAEYVYPGIFGINAANSVTAAFSQYRIYIPYYTSPIFKKLAYIQGGTNYIANAIRLEDTVATWEDGGATAINRIMIRTNNHSTDLFTTGSRLRIIGVRYRA